jgi:hypothetical protein
VPRPLLLVLIAVGFVLRIHEINRFSLRGDEAFTVIHWMREPLAQTLDRIATVDPQPPLAYAIYRAWALIVGSDEYIVRYLPAFLNVIGIPALYLLGKRFGGIRAGYLAALLWAIHPFQIWHAQDARNYALWGAASPVALAAGLRFLDRQTWSRGAVYLVAALIACYLYYLELFFVAALNLYVLILHIRSIRVLRVWFLVQVILGVCLAFWFLQGRLLFGSGYTGTALGFEPELLLTWFVPMLMFGETFSTAAPALFVFIFCLIALLLNWRRQYLLLLLWIVVPVIGLALVSTRLNVFTPRYVLAVSVSLVLLVVIAVARLGRFGWAFGFLVAGFSVFSLFSYWGLSNDYAKSPDWRGLASYLRERTHSDDLVIQSAADEAFTFYFEEYDVPGTVIRLPANPYQPESEIISIVEAALPTYSSIWVVTDPPPRWENGTVALDWFNDYAQLLRTTRIDTLPVRQFTSWEPEAGSAAPLAQFEDVTILLSATIAPLTEPTGEQMVWLEWLPLRTTGTPLKVFLHLIGSTNPATGTPLWSQDDQFPQDGRLNTTTWEIAPFRDVYALPVADLPDGEYRIIVGWYDPITNQRLTLNEAQDADSFEIGTLSFP